MQALVIHGGLGAVLKTGFEVDAEGLRVERLFFLRTCGGSVLGGLYARISFARQKGRRALCHA